jgi:hypothetical protein
MLFCLMYAFSDYRLVILFVLKSIRAMADAKKSQLSVTVLRHAVRPFGIFRGIGTETTRQRILLPDCWFSHLSHQEFSKQLLTRYPGPLKYTLHEPAFSMQLHVYGGPRATRFVIGSRDLCAVACFFPWLIGETCSSNTVVLENGLLYKTTWHRFTGSGLRLYGISASSG